MNPILVMTDFKVLALRTHYRKFVAHRLRRRTWVGKVHYETLVQVARKLDNVRYARLFMEAQFKCMSPEFCKEKFGRSYPPVNVVFGGNCWSRYREYVERGVRDGC